MSQTEKYLLVGIGRDAGHVGTMGEICPTWPDCPMGSPLPESPFNTTGYVTVKGSGLYTVIGGRAFNSEADATAWLQSDEAGIRFLNAFQNIVIVRGHD